MTCFTVKILSGLVLLLLAGCAALWQPVPARLAGSAWSLQPPPGWMRLATPSYEMFSKDGPYLHYIFVQQRSLDQGFRHTRQNLDPTLLPHEVAQVIVDNLRSDPQVAEFNLLASLPATLGGRPGFKLLYTHRDREGVAIRSIYYGAVLDQTFLNLRYTAAQRYYFDKHLEAFEKMLTTLRFSS